jgi:hypothetical protein
MKDLHTSLASTIVSRDSRIRTNFLFNIGKVKSILKDEKIDLGNIYSDAVANAKVIRSLVSPIDFSQSQDRKSLIRYLITKTSAISGKSLTESDVNLTDRDKRSLVLFLYAPLVYAQYLKLDYPSSYPSNVSSLLFGPILEDLAALLPEAGSFEHSNTITGLPKNVIKWSVTNMYNGYMKVPFQISSMSVNLLTMTAVDILENKQAQSFCKINLEPGDPVKLAMIYSCILLGTFFRDIDQNIARVVSYIDTMFSQIS